MRVQTFDYKLAGMRKPENWIVYPRKAGDATVIVQGSRSIGEFDPITRKGVLNWKGSNSKYFLHLNRILGAEPFEFPQEFVMLALNFMPSPGDLIGASPETGSVYLA